MEAGAGADETCSWCGTGVPVDDGFRLAGEPGESAVFCRLEHVIPWLIKGARWDDRAGAAGDEPGAGEAAVCAWCARELGTGGISLVRRRGEHRIADRFCDLDHLGAWAKAGGRFR